MPSKKKRDPADLGILKLDPKAGSILEKVSTQLNKTPTEIISEFIYSIYDLSTWNDYNCHHDHDENDSAKNVINKSDVALNFESTIRHLHLLPGLTESIAELTGRDQDVEICNFNMDLEKQIVEFSLGLGEQDLEKMFVRMGGGHIQLFTNRIRDCNFADGYTSSELEKIKEYAVKRVRKSVPYADVIVNVLEYEDSDGSSKSNKHMIEELELTIRSPNIRYLPTIHKFNMLMQDVEYCFQKRITTDPILSAA